MVDELVFFFVGVETTKQVCVYLPSLWLEDFHPLITGILLGRVVTSNAAAGGANCIDSTEDEP